MTSQQAFLSDKDKDKFEDFNEQEINKRNKYFAERTLTYFNMLSEMLERPDEYGSSFPFLESVFNYISHNEYITDKQIDIIDRISRHPENSYGEEYEDDPYLESPF